MQGSELFKKNYRMLYLYLIVVVFLLQACMQQEETRQIQTPSSNTIELPSTGEELPRSILPSGVIASLLHNESYQIFDQAKYRLVNTANGTILVNTTSEAVMESIRVSTNQCSLYSRLLSTGDDPIAWDSIGWDSADWNSVSWNSVGWNSVGWNSVGWNSVGWNE